MLDDFTLERRALLHNLALLLGTAALPAEALAAPRRGRRAPQHFLSAPQFALLSAVSDTIIPATDTPGAVAAHVPVVLDRMLGNWASPERRTALVAELAGIEQMAVAADGKSFAALTPARRKELLVARDRDGLKPGPTPEKPKNAFEAMIMGPPVMNPSWQRLKGLVINIYYNSEIACTQELIYEHVPGEWVPSLKVTPETRPWASAGPF